jgi:hypothetical protein
MPRPAFRHQPEVTRHCFVRSEVGLTAARWLGEAAPKNETIPPSLRARAGQVLD